MCNLAWLVDAVIGVAEDYWLRKSCSWQIVLVYQPLVDDNSIRTCINESFDLDSFLASFNVTGYKEGMTAPLCIGYYTGYMNVGLTRQGERRVALPV